ncbi:MAG TPA: tail fiber protein, partial [Nevskia sp.]|nr:tail fiber protein [Nevskia sp.]
ISQNSALFNLIGTTYGGDGQNTFALPDLRSRVPIHEGTNNQGFSAVIGQQAGSETVTLTVGQIPYHSHALQAGAAPADQTTAVGTVLAQQAAGSLYTDASPDTQLNANAVAYAGGSQPHNNIQPYLTLSFIIAMAGIFPSQT